MQIHGKSLYLCILFNTYFKLFCILNKINIFILIANIKIKKNTLNFLSIAIFPLSNNKNLLSSSIFYFSNNKFLFRSNIFCISNNTFSLRSSIFHFSSSIFLLRSSIFLLRSAIFRCFTIFLQKNAITKQKNR